MNSIAEDLLLLALDDEKGTIGWQHSASFPLGLAGAQIAELAASEHVFFQDKQLLVRDGAPTSDPLLDEALAMVAGSAKPHDAKHWVEALARPSHHLQGRLEEQLVEKGVLRKEEHRLLWVIPSSRFPAVDTAEEQAARDRLRAVVIAGAEPDQHTLVLLDLLKACGLERNVFSSDEWKQAKAKVKDLLAGEYIGGAVAAAIAAAEAAVTAATVATTVAASTASST